MLASLGLLLFGGIVGLVVTMGVLTLLTHALLVSAAFGFAALHRIGLVRALVALLVPTFVSAALVVGLLAAALANARF
jgi:hypothetical protein